MRHKVTTDLLYPHLWRGCVGAWAPCLGPSGSTLRGWAGRGNHGTLTNMDAATDWIPSSGQWALDFDGTDDYVQLRNMQCLDTGPASVSMWLNLRTTTINDKIFATDSTGRFIIEISNTASRRIRFLRQWTTTNILAAFNSAVTLNEWTHVVLTWDGGADGSTSVSLYSNGISLAQQSSAIGGTYLSQAGTNVLIGDSAVSMDGLMDDLRVYDRVLTVREIALLGRRRGIAYETKRRSRGHVAAAGITGPLIGGRLVGGAALIGGRLVR